MKNMSKKRALFSTTALAVVAIALGSGLALAQTWDGETDANWDTNTNWDNDAVPGAGDTVTINDGALANQPTVTTNRSAAQTNVSAGSLTVDATLTSPVTVSGTGVLTINAAGQVVGDVIAGGASGSNAGLISGSLTVAAGTFDIGTAAVTGTTTVTGGTLNLNGGTFMPTLVVDSGTVNVTAAETVGALAQSGGTIQGAGLLTSAGTFAQSGGDMAGTLAAVGAKTLAGGIISGTLDGAGATTTQTGITTVTGTINGDVTVAGGGTLRLASATAVSGTITTTGSTISYADGQNEASPIVLNSNDTALEVLAGDAAEQSGVISELGGPRPLQKIGAGSLTLSAANTYTGLTTVTAGTLVASNNDSLGTAAAGTTVADGATLALTGGITVADAVTLNGTGVASGGALRNLAGNNTVTGPITLASVSTISADAGQVTLSGGVSGANFDLTIGGTGNILISSAIATGTGTLTKEGTGIVALGGANTFTGTTTVNGGSLQLINGAAIADTAAVVLNAPSLLQVFNSETIGSLAGDGNTDIGAAAVLTTGGNNGSTLYSGVISGDGGVTKAGTGTFTLSGASTYAGATTINAGTLNVTGSVAGNVIINAGTLHIGNSNAIAGSITTNGSVIDYANGVNEASAIIVNSNTTQLQTLAGVTAEQSGDISELGGPRPLEKIGAGTLTLSGTNSYTGVTTVSAGTLIVSGGNAISDAGAVTVASGATFDLASNERIGSLSGVAGSTVDVNANTLTISEGNGNTFAGALTGTGVVDLRGTTTLTLTGNSSFSGIIGVGFAGAATGTMEFSAGATIAATDVGTAVDGTLILNGGNLTAAGAGITVGGTVDVNGSETAGAAFVANAGVLQIDGVATILTLNGTASALIPSGNTTIAGQVTGDGTLNISGGTTTVQATGNVQTATTIGAAGTVVNSGTMAGVGNAGTFTNNAGATAGDLTNSGAGAGSNAGTLASLTHNSTGTFDNGGAVTGNTSVSAGIVNLNAGTNLADAGTLTISGGAVNVNAADTIGTLDANGGTVTTTATLTTGVLSGGAGGRIATTATGGLVAGNATDSTFAGIISGPGTLTKTGTSTLTLTGSNAVGTEFTGTATVNQGTLRIATGTTFGDLGGGATAVAETAGTLDVDGTLGGSATINNGGTLTGIGTITQNLTVNAGGTLAPGGAPGTLAVGANVTLDAGATSNFQIGAPLVVDVTDTDAISNDLVIVGANLTLGGTLNLTRPGGGTILSGYYTLFDVAGTTTTAALANGGFTTVNAGASVAEVFVTNGGNPSNEVNVLIAGAGQNVQFWDGNNQSANGAVNGGTGVWNAARTNWTVPTGTVNDRWRSQVGIFQGTAGAVDVDGAQSFEGLQFRVDGYSVVDANGTAGSLVATGDSAGNVNASFLNIDAGVSTTINVNIAGAGAAIGLDKLGSGTLTLGGTNTLTGLVTVGAGTLINTGTLNGAAATGVTVAAGATFTNNAGSTVNGLVTNNGLLTTNNGTFTGSLVNTTTAVNNLTIAGSVANSGGFTNNGGVGAGLANSGTATNNGTISGGVNNTATGTYTSTAASVVNGGLTNANIVNAAGAINGPIANNAGTFTVTGGNVAGDAATTSFNNAAALAVTGGNFTGITTLTNTGTVNIAAGRTLQAGVINNNAGTITNAGNLFGTANSLTNNATLTSTGVVSDAFQITNNGTVNAQGALTAPTVTNNAAFNLTGDLSGTTTAPLAPSNGPLGTFTNNAGGNLAIGAFDFTGLTNLTNLGTVGIGAGGSLVAGGTIANNGGTLTNAGLLSSPTITNAATLTTSGAVTAGTLFANSGLAIFQAGSSLTAGTFTNTGTTNFASGTPINVGTFNAGGRTSLQNGVITDTLNVGGNLVGTGGTIAVDIDVGPNNAGGQQLSDRVVVAGDVQGTTTIEFNRTTNNFGLQQNPIIVIDANPAQANAATVTSNAGTSLIDPNGLVLYLFEQNPVTEDWQVRSVANGIGFAGLASSFSTTQAVLGSIVNRPSPPYAQFVQEAADNTCGSGVWMRGTGGYAKAETNSTAGGISGSAEVEVKYGGGQVAFDFGCYNINGNGSNVTAGVSVGYNSGSTSQDQIDPVGQRLLTDTDFDSRFVAGYVAYSKGAFAASLQARGDFTKFDVDSTVGNLRGATVDSKRATIAATAQYTFDLKNGFSLTPQAGVAVSRTTTSSINFAASNGLLDFDPTTSVVGFGGVSLQKLIILPGETSAIAPFVSAFVYNDFGEDPVSRFTDRNTGNSQDIVSQNLGTFGEIGVGASYFKILEGDGIGAAKEFSASIRGDVKFSDRLIAGGVTAQIRLQF